MLTLEQLAAFASQKSPQRDALAALLGLCTGSFLNVLALRSLKEENPIWPPSHCPSCKKRLALPDLIPVLSYALLKGKCRYCDYRIPWYYWFVEVFTAVTFVVVLHCFAGSGWDQLGMLVFSCILIAVCVTDFKEKIIPHEITYPAILLGLLYTGTVSELNPRWGEIPPIWSAMTGVGVSYILFDFLAFYGLKYYEYRESQEKKKAALEDQSEGDDAKAFADDDELTDSTETSETADPLIDEAFDIVEEPEDDEEFEVLGGGDAVMAALMAAWLGLDKLFIALLVGFFVGAIMGGCYMLADLHRSKSLRITVRPALIGASLIGGLFLLFLTFVARLSPSNAPSPLIWCLVGGTGALIGALLGAINAGKAQAKPYPFGPALAAGAFFAMLWNHIGNF